MKFTRANKYLGTLEELFSLPFVGARPILISPYSNNDPFVAIPIVESHTTNRLEEYIAFPYGKGTIKHQALVTTDKRIPVILEGVCPGKNWTVEEIFNGMIPMEEDTKHICCNPRAYEGKIITEKGVVLDKDSFIFIDVKGDQILPKELFPLSIKEEEELREKFIQKFKK